MDVSKSLKSLYERALILFCGYILLGVNSALKIDYGDVLNHYYTGFYFVTYD